MIISGGSIFVSVSGAVAEEGSASTPGQDPNAARRLRWTRVHRGIPSLEYWWGRALLRGTRPALSWLMMCVWHTGQLARFHTCQTLLFFKYEIILLFTAQNQTFDINTVLQCFLCPSQGEANGMATHITRFEYNFLLLFLSFNYLLRFGTFQSFFNPSAKHIKNYLHARFPNDRKLLDMQRAGKQRAIKIGAAQLNP